MEAVEHAGLEEQRVHDEKLHESQAKIRVVGLNQQYVTLVFETNFHHPI